MSDYTDPLDGIHGELVELRNEINRAFNNLKREVAVWQPLPLPHRPPQPGTRDPDINKENHA